MIEIGKKIINPKNSYKFYFEWSHCDADAYSNSNIIVDKNDKNLSRFLDYINLFDNIGGYDINKIKRIKKLQTEIKFFEKTEGYYFDYEIDNLSDNSAYATFDGVIVTYYDENGEEFEAKIINKK